METFKKFLIILATFVTLSGSSCSDCIDGFKEKNAEIKALEAEIKAQKGVRYADLEFAEQQAGAYRGCAFGFDTCPQSTAENGKISNQNGFFGVSSLWFFAIVFAKFGVIAALISIMLWLPMHLLVKFTKPLQGEIEAANLLISEAQTRAGAATARQIEAERLATLAEAKAQELATKNKQQAQQLAAAEAALSAKNQQIEAADQDIKEKKRIQAAFRKF